MLLLMPPKKLVVFLVAHCWLTVNLVATRTPRSFSVKLLHNHLVPSMYWYMELFLPTCRSLHSLCLRLLSAHFSSLLRYLWMVAWPSGVSATPPIFVSVANLLIRDSAPSLRILMKMCNSNDLPYPLSGYTASDWPPAGLHATTGLYDHNSESGSLDSFQLTVHLSNPYFISLSMRMLWETELKACWSLLNK